MLKSILTRKAYMYASLGNIKKLAAGGGQTSARRLVNVLRGLEYDICVVNRIKPAYSSGNLFLKLYKYYGYLADPFRWFFRLLFGHRQTAFTLVIGYSGLLFPFYFLFVRIAKLLGYKTIIYIKGGFTEKKYKSFPKIIQKSYIKGLLKADLAMYEGEEGTNLSEQLQPLTKAVWIPNYVEDGFAPHFCPMKSKDEINLLYFGRIHYEKNILMILDVYDQLSRRLANVSLTIVGSGDEDYEREIDYRISISPNKEGIYRFSRMGHEELKQILISQHFFIFPSTEVQEGHSNALNEAMSYGLIPIVSDNNFLPSIVGNRRLVVREMTIDAFVCVVQDVIESGDFQKISKEMYERVQNNFTQSIVEKKMKEMIDNLFS